MVGIKVFGYGSLMNESSLRRTAPNAENLAPAALKGYVRVFDLPTRRRMCKETGNPIAVLNIRKDDSYVINGVFFEVNEEDFAALRERELYYNLEEVEIIDMNGETHNVITFVATGYEPYDFILESPTQMKYYWTCHDGAEFFGEDFNKLFHETTLVGEGTLTEIFNLIEH